MDVPAGKNFFFGDGQAVGASEFREAVAGEEIAVVLEMLPTRTELDGRMRPLIEPTLGEARPTRIVVDEECTPVSAASPGQYRSSPGRVRRVAFHAG